jgi:hypothetical protein
VEAVSQYSAEGAPPRAWIRLHESPFEGEWVGISEDWAETLPCDPLDLAWTRLWICLRSPSESLLASRLLEEIQARLKTEYGP